MVVVGGAEKAETGTGTWAWLAAEASWGDVVWLEVVWVVGEILLDMIQGVGSVTSGGIKNGELGWIEEPLLPCNSNCEILGKRAPVVLMRKSPIYTTLFVWLSHYCYTFPF